MIEGGGFPMNRMTIVVALAAGLVGGVISRYVSPAPVLAQQSAADPAPVELRAQRFALVNQDGAIVATFMIDQPKPPDNPFAPPSIRLVDRSGKEIWSAGGNPVRKLALK
jgi:hypothetical protein